VSGATRASLALRLCAGLVSAGLLVVLLSQSTGRPSGAARGRAAQPVSSIQGAIDLPPEGVALDGPTYVIGWAVDTGSVEGPGVSQISIYLDGVPIKNAHYGLPRDDIAAAYGPQFREAGWQVLLDLDQIVTSGVHRLEVRVRSSLTGTESVFERVLSVASSPRFCVNAHPLWYDVGRAVSTLDRVRSNGLDSVRIDVNWESLQPDSPDSWNTTYLTRVDDVVDVAIARGLRPILVVLNTPLWARGSTGSPRTPPTDPTSYADTLGALAARYAARTAMVYEVWNEPNQREFWASPSGPDPAAYTSMLRAAYARIKQSAPNATVLGGSLAFNDTAYLQAMYAAGAAGAFDGLALHPYSGSHPPDSTDDPWRSFVLALDHTQNVLAAHGEGSKPIWITEMGWSSADVPDELRATYLQRAVQIVRSRNNIAAFCAYTLEQADDPSFGLISPVGAQTYSWLSYGQAVAANR
jgi:hypothetical protein